VVASVRVARVERGGIAAALGMERGTELLSVNGRRIADFLDWEFLSADEELVIEARQPDGEHVVYEVERGDGDSMGVELEPPTVRQCANRCEFCFIEGLPPGLRAPLYLRDDDYRLSFAYGNFATLSNVRERDVRRILEYRLSPLYVSVHATPPDVRRVLLNNPKVPDVIGQLTALAAGGIQFHCQMVIVPGVNDGAVLEQSLSDLFALGDAVLTTAIVPVGLTQFSHLYTGRTMDRDAARGLLSVTGRWAARAKTERGHPWVYGSDELYLLAEVPLPGAAHYGDFAQIENGVGSVTMLRQRVTSGLPAIARHDGRRIGVVTGTAMAPLMPPLLDALHEATGATFELLPTVNSLFGPTTTTAGLLTSADIMGALANRVDLDFAMVPAECINERGQFLDDRLFDDVREALPMPIAPSYDFIDVLKDGAK
jgi:putative radical SAM enzyme (TIGR03279 family)